MFGKPEKDVNRTKADVGKPNVRWQTLIGQIQIRQPIDKACWRWEKVSPYSICRGGLYLVSG